MEEETPEITPKTEASAPTQLSKIWEKLKAIVTRIAIVVFGVTVSISLQDMSAKRQERQDTKEFLLGLKEDLTQDIKEMESDKRSYAEKKEAFTYFLKVKKNQKVEKDSMAKYANVLFSSAELMPNNGRFEGFKSSGKMSTIDNKTLQIDIMDLYQEVIPILLYITHDYISTQKQLSNFINDNKIRVTDKTSNFLDLMKKDKARNIFEILSNTDQVLERYDLCINQMKKIIAQIDKEYNPTTLRH
jgi:hypothetical protein